MASFSSSVSLPLGLLLVLFPPGQRYHWQEVSWTLTANFRSLPYGWQRILGVSHTVSCLLSHPTFPLISHGFFPQLFRKFTFLKSINFFEWVCRESSPILYFFRDPFVEINATIPRSKAAKVTSHEKEKRKERWVQLSGVFAVLNQKVEKQRQRTWSALKNHELHSFLWHEVASCRGFAQAFAPIIFGSILPSLSLARYVKKDSFFFRDFSYLLISVRTWSKENAFEDFQVVSGFSQYVNELE